MNADTCAQGQEVGRGTGPKVPGCFEFRVHERDQLLPRDGA